MRDRNSVGEKELAPRVRQFLKAELKRADVTHEELALRMTRMGIEETKASVASKISRGSFSATFLIAALKAVDAKQIRLEDI